MEVGIATSVGRHREVNEDSLGYNGDLFVIADGMGGHKAGEVASALVIDYLLAMKAEVGEFTSLLPQALNEANQIILDHAAKNPDCAGMGTTVVAMKVEEDKALIGHVGDSRAYLWKQGKLTQLTRDHSVIEELIQGGGITEDEARNHPHRNLLTRALGTPGEVESDLLEVKVEKGNRILLCTDGLTAMLDDQVIEEIMGLDLSPQTLATILVEKANDEGGIDNITVMVIFI